MSHGNMVSRDLASTPHAHSYAAGVPTSVGASRAAPVASAGRVPAEPVPVHVNGSGVPMMYMDMRASSPTAPPDYVRHSPRTLGTVASAADGPAMVPADGLSPMLRKLSAANEQMWLAIGSAAETMDDSARALSAYDSALLHNPYSCLLYTSDAADEA